MFTFNLNGVSISPSSTSDYQAEFYLVDNSTALESRYFYIQDGTTLMKDLTVYTDG
jgi:hypothetical protein